MGYSERAISEIYRSISKSFCFFIIIDHKLCGLFCKDFALGASCPAMQRMEMYAQCTMLMYDVIYQRIKSILHSAFQQRMMSFGSTLCT